MLNEEAFDKKISIKFLQTLNRHLPVKRKTLLELLLEDKPAVKSKDGATYSFDKKELGKLAAMIPMEDHERLRLPIYLEMSASMERGAIKISGRLECAIMKRILEMERERIADSMTVYYPHLKIIRKELPTATQYIFTIS